MLAFYMTADTACKIYDDFMKENAQSEEARVEIIMRYKDELKSIVQTERTKEEFIADLAKHWTVAKITRKESGL